VILGTPDHSIIVVDENDTEDQLLQDRIGSPITKIAVAPNGKFLACFRRDGVLTVLSVTFTTKVFPLPSYLSICPSLSPLIAP
jgi:vacuolar protein sorting-associated protein 16